MLREGPDFQEKDIKGYSIEEIKNMELKNIMELLDNFFELYGIKVNEYLSELGEDSIKKYEVLGMVTLKREKIINDGLIEKLKVISEKILSNSNISKMFPIEPFMVFINDLENYKIQLENYKIQLENNYMLKKILEENNLNNGEKSREELQKDIEGIFEKRKKDPNLFVIREDYYENQNFFSIEDLKLIYDKLIKINSNDLGIKNRDFSLHKELLNLVKKY